MSKRTKPADTIEISWHIDDVKAVRPRLTDAQAREVLEQAKLGHNATIGINWDVLAVYADELFPRDEETPGLHLAAQDLLEALQAVCDLPTDDAGERIIPAGFLNQARAAIARAKRSAP